MGNRLRKLIAAESICGLFYDIVFAYEFLFLFLTFWRSENFFRHEIFFVLFINTVYGAAAYCAQTLTLCGFPGSFPISKGPMNDVKGPTFDVFGQKSAHFLAFLKT